jgi:hypothetical protein
VYAPKDGNSVFHLVYYLLVLCFVLRHSKKYLDGLSKLDLGMLLMQEYIEYPLPTKEFALVPFNYCALGKEVPFLKPMLSLIC